MDDLSDAELAALAVGRLVTFRPKNAAEQDYLDYLTEEGEWIIYSRLLMLVDTLPRTDPMRVPLRLWLDKQAEHLLFDPKEGRPANDYKPRMIRRAFAWEVMTNPGRKLTAIRWELRKKVDLGERQFAELTKGIDPETAEKVYWQCTRPAPPEHWPTIWYTPVMFDITDTGVGGIYLEGAAPKEG
jgi:hypothetical protein